MANFQVHLKSLNDKHMKQRKRKGQLRHWARLPGLRHQRRCQSMHLLQAHLLQAHLLQAHLPLQGQP
jgi:hypothetical protein